MKVYWYEGNGTLYSEDEVDPSNDGYVLYEVPAKVTLSVEDCLGHDGDILEILLASGQARRVV